MKLTRQYPFEIIESPKVDIDVSYCGMSEVSGMWGLPSAILWSVVLFVLSKLHLTRRWLCPPALFTNERGN
jgi:hypothetical protein